MAITRTPMVDDDGSGTTGTVINNAWKQELYDQIDASAGGLVYGAWTPVDLSGASLVLVVTAATYVALGRILFVWGHVTYPANSAPQPAILGGLPYASGGQLGGFYQTYGPPCTFHVSSNSNMIYLLNSSTMVGKTNQELSGSQLIFNGQYLRP